MGTGTSHHPFFFRQVVGLVTLIVHLPFGTLDDLLMPVSVQLAVRIITFRVTTSNYTDAVIRRSGNVSNYRTPTNGEQQLT